jgi:hypothetical protein
MMEVKKIQNAPFHLGNRLHGSKPRARYGIFKDGKQVGVVLGDLSWHAWDMECKKQLLTFSCGSLADLKKALANK